MKAVCFTVAQDIDSNAGKARSVENPAISGDVESDLDKTAVVLERDSALHTDG